MKRVEVKNVSKVFKIGYTHPTGALKRVLSFFSGREPKRDFWALRDVSFSVNAGEMVGLIGDNGSGKSTLLRVIAGVYEQTSGTVRTSGNLLSLISLFAGMKLRMNMKDNIYLYCTLNGLDRKEIDGKFDSIVEFSGLGRYVDTKLYQFSDGMRARLGFATAMHCNPKILLLDDVYSVGDAEFSKKSMGKVTEMVRRGASVILVTHSLGRVSKNCDRAVWLDGGRVMAEGAAKDVVRKYQLHVKQKEGRGAQH